MRQYNCRWIDTHGVPVDASEVLHEASHRRDMVDVPTDDGTYTPCLVHRIIRKPGELHVELVPMHERGVIIVTHQHAANPADIEVTIYTQG